MMGEKQQREASEFLTLQARTIAAKREVTGQMLREMSVEVWPDIMRDMVNVLLRTRVWAHLADSQSETIVATRDVAVRPRTRWRVGMVLLGAIVAGAAIVTSSGIVGGVGAAALGLLSLTARGERTVKLSVTVEADRWAVFPDWPREYPPEFGKPVEVVEYRPAEVEVFHVGE